MYFTTTILSMSTTCFHSLFESILKINCLQCDAISLTKLKVLSPSTASAFEDFADKVELLQF